jgi:photosystem I subunit 3
LQYEADSAPALALKATIEKTERRFDNYAKQGLLCGTDGLPHLIADPGLALRYGHAGDVFIPTIGFIYFAGWLGFAGTKYLQETRSINKEVSRCLAAREDPAALRLGGSACRTPSVPPRPPL